MSSDSDNLPIERDERDCRTCRYYEVGNDPVLDAYGECHRNAPIPRLTTEEYPKDVVHVNWPWVRYNDYCGEWAWNAEMDLLIVDPEQNPRGEQVGDGDAEEAV